MTGDKQDDEFKSVINGFLKDIHSGKIKPGQIHDAYYNAVGKRLIDAAGEGLGGNVFGADDYKNTLKSYLDQNIWAFSGARSLYMLQQYNSFLTDKNGRVLSEAEFISKVADITDIDNLQHLKVERQSAIACAQMAEKWQGLQAFGTLEYSTVGDDKVRPQHAVLDKLTLATDDPRLNIIYPPNGFGCRCNMIPGSKSATPTNEVSLDSRIKAADIQPYFRRNVGKEKLIYSDDHPYIEKIGANNLKELDAEKNYGMRSPEKIYKTADNLPTYKPLEDKEAANKWWMDKAGEKRGSFEMKGIDGLSVTFDNSFRNHVLEDNSNDRFRFLNQIDAVLKTPDEVWTNRIRGKVTVTYIKYYNDYPIVLAVGAEEPVRAVTFYEAQKAGKINYTAVSNLRKGALKYKSH